MLYKDYYPIDALIIDKCIPIQNVLIIHTDTECLDYVRIKVQSQKSVLFSIMFALHIQKKSKIVQFSSAALHRIKYSLPPYSKALIPFPCEVCSHPTQQEACDAYGYRYT